MGEIQTKFEQVPQHQFWWFYFGRQDISKDSTVTYSKYDIHSLVSFELLVFKTV